MSCAFQQPFFNLVPAEIRWGCHVCLPARRCYPPAGHQSRTATVSQAIAWLWEIALARLCEVAAAFTRTRHEAAGGGVLPGINGEILHFFAAKALSPAPSGSLNSQV